MSDEFHPRDISKIEIVEIDGAMWIQAPQRVLDFLESSGQKQKYVDSMTTFAADMGVGFGGFVALEQV